MGVPVRRAAADPLRESRRGVSAESAACDVQAAGCWSWTRRAASPTRSTRRCGRCWPSPAAGTNNQTLSQTDGGTALRRFGGQSAGARKFFRSSARSRQRGDEAGFVAEGAEEVGEAFVVRAEPGGAKPGGNGASALGEEEAAQQRQQAPGVAGVQRRGEVGDPQHHLGRQGPCDHASAPRLRRRAVQSRRGRRSRSLTPTPAIGSQRRKLKEPGTMRTCLARTKPLRRP
jgi:hypothetical protein